MNTGMSTLLNTLDSTMYSGLSQITDTKQILQTTRPLPEPKMEPMIYLVPESVEKILHDNDSSTELIHHLYVVSIIVVTSYRTTQEASLTDDDNGLIQLMDDIETLLESDTLSKILISANIYPESYMLDEDTFADNIYTRAGSLRYEAETISYNSTIHRT